MSETTNVFKDILKHTHQLGIFELVRIRGGDTEMEVETVNSDKTVILKGRLFKTVPEFEETTLGLSRMGILQGFLNFEGFTNDTANVTIEMQERNEGKTPVEVKFKSDTGTTANYRFMASAVVDQQMKDIKFHGASYDVTFTPTEKNLKDLMYFHSVLGSYEASFVPKVEDGHLYFYIGGGASDRTRILIKENITGTIKHEHTWDLDIVLKILKLGETGIATMSINNMGLLQVQVDSGTGEYTYLLPTKG